jgi:hypothetical protein
MPNPAQAQIQAQINAEVALRAQAKRTIVSLIKQRARAYAKRPMTLENVLPGLAAASPETMIAVAAHLIETERRAPRRWFGFGGEVPILNAKAVLLLARALRLSARAHTRSAALRSSPAAHA